MASPSPQPTVALPDGWTVVAIAILVDFLSVLAHEALGHGLAALVVGLHPSRVSSVDLVVSFRGAALWQMRVVSAAGCAANLALAGIALAVWRRAATLTGAGPSPAYGGASRLPAGWAGAPHSPARPAGRWGARPLDGPGAGRPAEFRGLLRRRGSPSQRRDPLDWYPPARFFWWLLATVNLLIPGGYLLFGAPIGFGDWGDFDRGLHPLWAWKIALTALGLAISLAGLRWGAKHLRSLVPSGAQGRRSAWRFTLWPYLTGGFVSMAAAAFNPTSPILIVTSAAAASFGGTCWLLWIGSIVARHPPHGDPPPPLRREPRWMVAGAVALALYLAVLGPGLPR